MQQSTAAKITRNHVGRMPVILFCFLIVAFLCTTSVFADIVIDNGDPGTSFTGTWAASGASGAYGDNSVWSRDGDTYTWSFGSQPSGTYEVLMWWTQWPSRSTNIPITITHAGGTTTVNVNQQADGGQWNSLGQFTFTAGQGHKVVITSQAYPSSTCADAVWFKTGSSQQAVIIDNSNYESTQRVGTWEVSGATGSYNTGSVWSRDGATFSWLFNPPASGNYKLSMWWTQWSSRSTSVPVDIEYAGGTDDVTINQQTNGGKWNEIGTYQFNMGTTYKITITAQPNPTSTCADAVKFDLAQGNGTPTAVIDSITPNPAAVGQSVSFTGHGQDSDGTIKSYAWESSIDGDLSTSASFSKSDLSAGNHVITLRVTDDDNSVSAAVTSNLTVNAASSDLIIDNSDYTQTTRTGTWEVSGAPGFYGTGSIWSRDGATFKYHINVPTSGNYNISLWWAEWSSRSTSVPVDIEHASGTTRVTVNQQTNGGQWNSLGVFSLQANTTYDVTITAQPGPSSTCADALKCTRTSQSSGPVAAFAANQTSGARPLTVQFSDQSTGTISQWQWNFGDGQTSTAKNPSHTYNNSGTYNVSLTVSGSSGSDTETKSGYIYVRSSNTENIYLIDCYSGSPEFTRGTVEMFRRIGAAQLSTNVWQYQRAGITYRMQFIKNSADALDALKEQGSHIVIAGHANYGFGGIFSTDKQTLDGEITDLYYVDDDRFINYGSDMISTKVDGMKYGQAYPNWEPRYRSGRSALAPYTFSQGTPPYNYYLTYKIPGDSTNYRIELANGTYLQRFPDSGVPAWYSATGAKPDPVKNPEYFIVNNETDFNRCSFVGSWPIKKVQDGGYTGETGYKGYNYQVRWPGSAGSNKAIWNMVIKYPGQYKVYASWYPDNTNATNAPYKINYAGGSSTVYVNQRTTNLKNQLNLLGTYNFNPGSYTIELSDKANGQVVADAILINSVGNPSKVFQAEFNASIRSGSAPLTVQFGDTSSLYDFTDTENDVNSWSWNFGDGTSGTLKNPSHTYTKAGTYTVSLRVIDNTGASVTETKNRLIVVGQTSSLEAEFTASGRFGADKTIVTFKDQSSGNITSRLWNFGDGATSTEQNPVHTYSQIGIYDVKLTVTGTGGSNTETETDFVNNLSSSPYCDNTHNVKPHFYSRRGTTISGKVICDLSSIRIPQSELGYTRMYHGSCNSLPYFTDTLHRGIMFANTSDVEIEEFSETTYLELYLKGYSDQDILTEVNKMQNNHELCNFNLKPPSMR